MIDLIAELKDPKRAQPFGIYEKYYPEKAQILKKAKKVNCLLYDIDWVEAIKYVDCFAKSNTYILKPDYQPEPEYVDYEIAVGSPDNMYGAYLGDDGPYPFVHLHCLPSLPGFEKFWLTNTHGEEVAVRPDYVVHRIEKEGKTVYARFEREEREVNHD